MPPTAVTVQKKKKKLSAGWYHACTSSHSSKSMASSEAHLYFKISKIALKFNNWVNSRLPISSLCFQRDHTDLESNLSSIMWFYKCNNAARVNCIK